MVAALILVGLCMAACSGNDGVSATKPSTAQLNAMSTYFVGHFAMSFDFDPSRAGCVTSPIGTHPESEGRLIAYTLVACRECPVNKAAASGAITPAVFVLHDQAVTKADADTQPGDPMFANEIKRMFPQSLQSAAEASEVPHLSAVFQRAAALGGC